MKRDLRLFYRSLLHSYSQVFFSNSRLFSFLLIVVSFTDFYAGLFGLIAVIVTNSVGFLMGFDKRTVSRGLYGFNSLLVGLGLGIYYEPSVIILLIIVLASVFTLFISVSLQGVLGKYGIPYLSIPFIIGAWVVTLAAREFSSIGLSERGIFTFNELYTLGGSSMVHLYEWWNSIEIWRPVRIYFISLGAILFQYNTFAGMVIAAGLLLQSRISFSLSVIGFFTAYLFYEFTGTSISELNYSYIGFNYILTSIALGGFFIIPSVRSYLWVIFLVPVVALLTISLSSLFSLFSLPVYALPFNIVVLLFLYILKFRVNPSGSLAEVYIQQNSPEKNLYSHSNHLLRFRPGLVPVKLPFFGIWQVAQGHNGEHTHKGDWRHAWDFIITDREGKQYRGEGNNLSDYYCYNKPVVAVADGVVEHIIDNVEDNVVGDANLLENWGNSVIIKHADYLYSSVSHLIPGSITVKEGMRIKQGEIVGKCGNSGRSPYPHLHFQMQETPYIGSRTLNYPVSYFIGHTGKTFTLNNFAMPEEGMEISNIEVNEMIKRAFDFIPGRKMSFEVNTNGIESIERWEVFTDEYNNSYIKCIDSGAIAYFENDGNMIMFRHYEGKRDGLLYYFYLSAFKVQQGFYPSLEVKDKYPLNLFIRGSILFIQDFIAPFYKFLASSYTLKYKSIDSAVSPSKIEFESIAENSIAGRVIRTVSMKLLLGKNGITSLRVEGKRINISARCTE